MDGEGNTVSLRVRQIVRTSQNTLSDPEVEDRDVIEAINQIKNLLPPNNSPETYGDHNFSPELLSQVRREFQTKHYRLWLEYLIKLYSVEWIKKLPDGGVKSYFDVFFLEGVPSESFITLVKTIGSESQLFKVQKCANMLEAFLSRKGISRIVWDQCEVGKKQKTTSGKVDQFTQQNWHELITLMCSIPERLTNKLRNESADIFYPDMYVKTVSTDVLEILGRLHDGIKQNRETSVLFLSQFVGKFCLVGFGGRFWKEIMPVLVVKMENDYIWSRIMENVLNHIPDMTIEATITPMIEVSPWYGTVVRLLGNTVLTRRKLEFLLTNKMFLLRHYSADIIPQNIIGYLATSPSRKHLYLKLIESLLTVWGDSSAVKHTSYAQHLYISKAILICIAFLSDKDAEEYRSRFSELLMPGMHPHLDSPLPQIHRLGMIVAENISKKIDQKMPHTLSFQYEKDDEVESLIRVLNVPTDPGIPISQNMGLDTDNNASPSKLLEEVATRGTPLESSGQYETNTEELDSDDDLEPYDLSNDTKTSKVKAPAYVRDCMEGLISSDDADKVDISLSVAEKLIRKNPSTVKEVAVDFTKILIHLDDRFSLPAFSLRRQMALIALATSSPAQVADYLTSQFYDPNYNIRQRLDILEVLSSAARRLARPEEVNTPQKQALIQEAGDGITAVDDSSSDWRKVVQRRIDAKTRRFASGTQTIAETPNKFSKVAGHFFFPLLKNFDRPEMTLDLLGRDHLALSRLLYTLGVIVYAAVNTQIVRQMGLAMLEFVWAVRFHPQPAVRQGALFATSMVILSIPSFILVTDLQKDITDAQTWLEGVAQDDSDKECQKMAVQALVLIQKAVKEVVL